MPEVARYLAWSVLPCATWPVHVDEPPGPVRAPGAAPILVIGTTHDPATPMTWARALAGQLDSGVLLTRDGDGHTAIGSGSRCVSRAVAAVAEQHHDDKGLVWPREVSPADVHIVATGKEDAPFEAAESMADRLNAAGVRVLLDDRRGVSPGVKFNDAELIGVPTIVVVGKRLVDGQVEMRDRASGDSVDVPVGDIVGRVVDLCRRA